MKKSKQNLKLEFKAGVFAKAELEFQDMSELKSLLPPLTSRDSNSDVEVIFRDT